MNNVYLFITILLVASIFYSCEKDEAEISGTIDSFDDGVFITCEGAFGQGNASVYFLDPQKMGYVPEIYYGINQEPLGDVLQSITFENNKAYMVINNSGRIVEVDEKTFLKTGGIEGLSAPTEVDIENGKGYIGSLYSKHVLVADMARLTIIDSLYLGEQSNFIRESDNRLWVLSQTEFNGRTKNHTYFINLSDSSVDSIKVGSNPVSWAFDDTDHLYVYCQGMVGGDGPAIYTIDIATPSVTSKTELNAPANFFGKIAYDEFENRLLVQLSHGIYTYRDGDGSVSDAPLISLGEVEFMYGLGVSPEDGDVYIGDAKDFNRAGVVYIYSSEGQLKSNLPVGVAPNHFYFE